MKCKLSRLKDEADREWSLAVRRRDRRCVACGSKENLQAHHWRVPRGASNATRWNIGNGVTLCSKHHIIDLHRRGDFGVFKSASEYMIGLIGGVEEESIDQLRHAIVKFGLQDMEDIIQGLKGMHI